MGNYTPIVFYFDSKTNKMVEFGEVNGCKKYLGQDGGLHGSVWPSCSPAGESMIELPLEDSSTYRRKGEQKS